MSLILSRSFVVLFLYFKTKNHSDDWISWDANASLNSMTPSPWTHYNLHFGLHAEGRPFTKCKIPLQKLETTLAPNLYLFRLFFEKKNRKVSQSEKEKTFKFYSMRIIKFEVKKLLKKQTVLTIIKTISCQNSFLARTLVAIQKNVESLRNRRIIPPSSQQSVNLG